MSFWTELQYFRPRPAPSVTADDLARFMTAICETKTLASPDFLSLTVKFGDAIDQDDRRTSWEEEIEEGIYVSHDIEWDVELPNPSGWQEMIDCLAGDDRRIYRAHVSLGVPTEEILTPITREPSPENEAGFYPDMLVIDLGPVYCLKLDTETPLMTGWLRLAICGSGYLYPWTMRDLVKRIEADARFQRLMNVCKSFWPVPFELPARQVIEIRKQLGDEWAYEDPEKPWDWYWGVAESG